MKIAYLHFTHEEIQRVQHSDSKSSALTYSPWTKLKHYREDYNPCWPSYLLSHILPKLTIVISLMCILLDLFVHTSICMYVFTVITQLIYHLLEK